MVRGRDAYWSAPMRRLSSGATRCAARNTAISAASSGCRPDEGFGPCGCGGRCPGACGGANVVGQFGDEVGATMQVLTPLRILAELVGYGGQPAQRADAGRMAAGGVDAPIEHGGGVAGVVEPAFGDGLGEGLGRVVSCAGQQAPGGCAARASPQRG